VKKTNAIAGRLLDSRIAKCTDSTVHPSGTQLLTVFSRVASSTVDSSTTLYCNTTASGGMVRRLVGEGFDGLRRCRFFIVT
jgi:uncharacterized protein (DUF1810 family)